MDRFAPCPDTPNCVFSDAPAGSHHVDPFVIAGTPHDWDALWSAVAEEIERQPRTEIVVRTERYIHAECRSLLFRFVDDLELQLRPDRGQIAVRSASRVGYSDLGVNRRRVEALRVALRKRGLVR